MGNRVNATSKRIAAVAPHGSKSPSRRRQRRVSHRVPCRVSVIDPTGRTRSALVGQTINISADGLAVQVREAIPNGVLIEALVPQPDADPLRFHGTVLHSRRVLGDTYEIGIGVLETDCWRSS